METSRWVLCEFILLALVTASCDEEFTANRAEDRSAREKLLANDWQYQFVYVGTDTTIVIDSLTIKSDTIRAFADWGEPVTETERFSDVRLTSIWYGTDKSYALRTNRGFSNMGYDANYQPNYGYWDIEESGDSTILIHNKLLIYEKRYVITTLTEDSLVRRLIGPRVVYFFQENQREEEIIAFTAHTWIEVFTPKGN